MKVLHITWAFTFGGIETMLVNIANEQVALGHEVHILVIEHNSVEPTLAEKLNSQIKLYLANRKYGVKDLLYIFRLNKIIWSVSPDTIHLHSNTIYKYILFPNYKKICNVTMHDVCDKENTSFIQWIPRVFSISEAVAKDLKSQKGVQSIVVLNGIKPELIKEKKEYKNSIWHIVQVSRLMHKKKGQDILLNAVSVLKHRGYENFKISFIGDGESMEFLQHLSLSLGINDKVEFLGSKSQEYLFNNLCDFDLFVQPSRYEGFGLTVAEAMAAKLPVIVSSGDGPEEIVDHGKYGYVFRNGDVKDLADKIEVFLRDEYDKSMIEKAYDRVWNLYNIKVTSKTYLANYIRR